MKRIRAGKYLYRGYEITCCGYHPPDKCVWWEAVNVKTGCADYHAHRKKDVKDMIDEFGPCPN